MTGWCLTDLSQPDRAQEQITAYARRHNVGAVLTVNEYLTDLTAYICADLDLPGNVPALARAARDKAVMADTLTAAGVRIPRTRPVRDHHQARAALADPRIGLPCVIKPVGGSGSAGVTVATSLAEVGGAVDTARAAVHPAAPVVLVQAYVTGTQYSVESLTRDGATTHLAITRKTVTAGAQRVELAHSLPARLPPDVQAAVYQQVDTAVHAVGVRNGASHTEVIVDETGRCTVIEVAARLGAGHIAILIGHALGIDVFTALVDVAFGHRPNLARTVDRYATVRFVTSPGTGRFANVEGLPEPGPDVPLVRWRVEPGSLVHEPATNAHRLGCFIVTGDRPAVVEEHADMLLRQIIVHVHPDVPPADQPSSASTSAIAP
ncbi:ATP-grasp domain-containing protein [Actinomadura meridiana]|uniref:ATP-grasp domain-containing protein n=1 Tax=Actinomadura meridiana TaxID=559626 RepID=A0ABP8C6H2_9ACTN